MKKLLIRCLVLACLLCLTGCVALFVWWLYRPLNDVEKQLIGTWRNTTVNSPRLIALNADRTTNRPGKFWHVEGSTIFESDGLVDDVREVLAQIVFRIPRRAGSIVSIVDADHFELSDPASGETFCIERVKPQAEGSVGGKETPRNE